jgi:hypothetical protein
MCAANACQLQGASQANMREVLQDFGTQQTARPSHKRKISDPSGMAPVYNITLNITGDVNAALSLFTKDNNGVPLSDI